MVIISYIYIFTYIWTNLFLSDDLSLTSVCLLLLTSSALLSLGHSVPGQFDNVQPSPDSWVIFPHLTKTLFLSLLSFGLAAKRKLKKNYLFSCTDVFSTRTWVTLAEVLREPWRLKAVKKKLELTWSSAVWLSACSREKKGARRRRRRQRISVVFRPNCSTSFSNWVQASTVCSSAGFKPSIFTEKKQQQQQKSLLWTETPSAKRVRRTQMWLR